MTKKVACGSFVKRQTADSGFSHFDGTWESLEDMTSLAMNNPFFVSSGYKDGVILVDLDPKYFKSGTVKLESNSKLNAVYSSRLDGEDPYIRIGVLGKKQPAKVASVVLYRADVLDENNERETDAQWEIVAIKASPSLDEEPMSPYTMARNFLHLKGGTKANFTAEQFAQSILYWNNHAITLGKPKWYKRIIFFIKNIYSYICNS